ncbi:MAG: SMC-Scp complex subunit ScpB [Chloroflexi bacterium]|nr:SMC-Scp complex subunit ScpB [Chloroflexota bacterium]
MDDIPDITSTISLENQIEALLFVASSRVSTQQLAETLGKNTQEIYAAMQNLEKRYEENSGLRIQWHAGKVQLTTAPETALMIERFLGLEATSKLSRAALEALTIIAYKQPITRPGVDAIRGVNSDGVIRSLLSKGLIEEISRSEGPGRPIIYGTTEDFLGYFGINSLNELPPIEDEVENGNNKLLKE